MLDTKSWLQNFEIYVGNSEDYSWNKACPGGPYQKVDDTSSSYLYDSDKNHYLWNFGKEVWCNLEGQFVTILADLSALANEDWYTMSICSLGVMGTEYVRDKKPPTTIQLNYMEAYTLSVENIYSKETIGNVLDIQQEQASGSTLSWVTIIQGSPTSVTLSPDPKIAAGAYTLKLRSFDNNSGSKSTLKLDEITINLVQQFSRAESVKTVEVKQNDNSSFKLLNIQSDSPSVKLDIKVRQATSTEQLDWITIQQGSPTEIFLSPKDKPPGVYKLVLESYHADETNPILHSDVIEVVVVDNL